MTALDSGMPDLSKDVEPASEDVRNALTILGSASDLYSMTGPGSHRVISREDYQAVLDRLRTALQKLEVKPT